MAVVKQLREEARISFEDPARLKALALRVQETNVSGILGDMLRYDAFAALPSELQAHYYTAYQLMVESGSLDGKLVTSRLPNARPIKEAIADMISPEIGTEIAIARVLPVMHDFRTTVLEVVDTILGNDETTKVAMPTPNAYAVDYNNPFMEDRTVFFQAYDGASLVEGFRELVEKDSHVKALFLLNPSRPVLYHIQENEARAIDELAEQHGISVVLSEPTRGLMPKPTEYSAYRHFKKAYLVEGFDLRFGYRPFSELSYVIFPQGVNAPSRMLKALSPQSAYSIYLGSALDDVNKHAVEGRNEVLKKNVLGFVSYFMLSYVGERMKKDKNAAKKFKDCYETHGNPTKSSEAFAAFAQEFARDFTENRSFPCLQQDWESTEDVLGLPYVRIDTRLSKAQLRQFIKAYSEPTAERHGFAVDALIDFNPQGSKRIPNQFGELNGSLVVSLCSAAPRYAEVCGSWIGNYLGKNAKLK